MRSKVTFERLTDATRQPSSRSPGFTISTEVSNIYFQNHNTVPEEINHQMLEALRSLEERMGQRLGDVNNPLLVSVRSGAKFSMPGMMDTILNLGLNDETVKAIDAKSNNSRFAYDCYRRFLQMYGNVVLDIGKDEFEQIFDGQKKKAKETRRCSEMNRTRSTGSVVYASEPDIYRSAIQGRDIRCA